jgi:hypothetical protein
MEQRTPAPWPELEYRPGAWRPKTRSLLAWPAGFERWFNDRLGFRQPLVSMHSLARWHGLVPRGEALANVPGTVPVIVGRDGWLFYSAESSLDDYRNARPWKSGEREAWIEAWQSRARWLQERACRYVVVIAPNKHTIYGEYMPRSLDRVGQRSRLDDLLAALPASGELTVIDLRGPLLEAKQHTPVYHRTDTHWNDAGAAVGCREIVTRLKQWFPRAAPRGLEDFILTTHDRHGGDLTTMLGMPKLLRESWLTAAPKSPRRAQMVDEGLTPYRMARATCPTGELGHAVVLHDSFIEALAPFLNEHFQRVKYIRTHNFPREMIEQENPDVVIQEYVERALFAPLPKP